MKLFSKAQPQRASERGFFLVIVMLVIASILLIYVAANGHRLANLKCEIRLVEQRQIQRLNRATVAVTTNAPPPTVPSAAAP